MGAPPGEPRAPPKPPEPCPAPTTATECAADRNPSSVMDMSNMFADATAFKEGQSCPSWAFGVTEGPCEVTCEDTAGDATDQDGDVCAVYSWPDCGNYDDDDFQSNVMCCVCGGGSTGCVDRLEGDLCSTSAHWNQCVEDPDYMHENCPASCGFCDVCEDAGDATDSWGDGCADYTFYPSYCGLYDDDDFNSFEMCCACGGGSTA